MKTIKSVSEVENRKICVYKTVQIFQNRLTGKYWTFSTIDEYSKLDAVKSLLDNQFPHFSNSVQTSLFI